MPRSPTPLPEPVNPSITPLSERALRLLLVVMLGVLVMLAYILIWTGFSAAATGGQWLGERMGLMSDMMASARPWFSGSFLIR
jgi:predicted metal-binding membrane protein